MMMTMMKMTITMIPDDDGDGDGDGDDGGCGDDYDDSSDGGGDDYGHDEVMAVEVGREEEDERSGRRRYKRLHLASFSLLFDL
eukprot:88757-Hanusia_phi.AAC.3